MKKCAKCRAYNSNERQFCVDCSERLSEILSEQEETVFKNSIDENIEKLYNSNDPLYISTLDKIVGFISLLGIVALMILGVVNFISKRSSDYFICGYIVFVSATLTALTPKFLWGIEKLRLSFTISNSDDATPSNFYFFCRKISETICCIIGVVIICFAFLNLLKPPVVKYIDEIASNPTAMMYSYTSAYIEAEPELWNKIIISGDYAVDIFLTQLENAEQTGLKEQLMMCAIVEINKIEDNFTWNTKDDFLFQYYSRPPEIIVG
ncbi:MAG: hypothetical protein PHH84_04240 [Oscillospiraceae bacterium]|nr:hypothetical protein [Oscillospiraceae bacterium]MDD4414094.1 hypothetical protein [Oscillospiraceae bacterium]